VSWPWPGVIEVRDDGSVWRLTADGRPITPRRIDLDDTNKGYRNVVLPHGGRWRTFKAHRLVWMWHHGPIPDGLQINHRNLIKHDNRLANLELVTPAGNIQHSYANGRRRPWSEATEWRTGRPRVTPQQRREIMQLRNRGVLLREIADAYGISTSHVYRIYRQEGGTPGE
jgi:hypothetical protein